MKKLLVGPLGGPITTLSVVGDEGIGPSTSVLSGQRSTTELRARAYNLSKTILNFTR